MLATIQAWRRKRYIRNLVARGLELGKNVYLNDGFFLDPAHCFLIRIEDGVVFGPGVRIFAHDASSKVAMGKTKVGRVTLGRGCFIGAGSIILPGSSVGAGSILGAGSVLSGHIAEGEVWTGSPARPLMTVAEYRERLSAKSVRDFPEEQYRMGRIGSQGKAEMLVELKMNRFAFLAPANNLSTFNAETTVERRDELKAASDMDRKIAGLSLGPTESMRPMTEKERR